MFIKHDFILLHVSGSMFICYMYTHNAVKICEFVMNWCMFSPVFNLNIQVSIFFCEELGCFTGKKTYSLVNRI